MLASNGAILWEKQGPINNTSALIISMESPSLLEMPGCIQDGAAGEKVVWKNQVSWEAFFFLQLKFLPFIPRKSSDTSVWLWTARLLFCFLVQWPEFSETVLFFRHVLKARHKRLDKVIMAYSFSHSPIWVLTLQWIGSNSRPGTFCFTSLALFSP